MRTPRILALAAATLLSIPTFVHAAVVINEVDYDQIGTDAAEFVELRNNGPGSVDLSEYTLELVNGNAGGAAIYLTVNTMTGTLAAGDYYVICGNAGTVANCDLVVLPATNLVQNGSPDAIGLRHLGILVDAVSYEGNTGAPYTEGTGTSAADDNVTADIGLSRVPDGVDTDDNNSDFVLQGITPGASNGGGPSVPATAPIALILGAGALALGGGRRLFRRRTA